MDGGGGVAGARGLGSLIQLSKSQAVTLQVVIARSEATKQSILSFRCAMDCFATLAMTAKAAALEPRRWSSGAGAAAERRRQTPSLRGALATKQSMPVQDERWIASLRSQ
jgi:hypothetical protein